MARRSLFFGSRSSQFLALAVTFGLFAASSVGSQLAFGFQSEAVTGEKESALSGQEDATSDTEPAESEEEVIPGHSYHGEAFNEGPRQKAYLMGGTGNIDFPVTTENEEAQKFFNQGIGQLHGFWDLEAERSFRQVASIDPDCAMAYWGMALATIRNKDRSKGFIAEAVSRKNKVSAREREYIEALDKYINHKSDDKKVRAAAYLRDLETISINYPEDVEAKAFVAHRVWQNSREGIPVASYLATDALLNDIYQVNPLHPAHHYTIHLWDYRKPERAVASAEKCGAAAPNIAHMWHMPGHIYSRLHEYEKAIYQQEASARVDHDQMIRDQVMPDEIHNYAHNNEWLIRNLVFVGRVHDALDLAKNMTELPKHPKYNTLKKRGGSASYGRRRLMQVLREYQLFEDAVSLCESSYLTGAEDTIEEIKRLRLLGTSSAMLKNAEKMELAKSQLTEIKAESEANVKETEEQIKQLKEAIKQAEADSKKESDTETVELVTEKVEKPEKEKVADNKPDASAETEKDDQADDEAKDEEKSETDKKKDELKKAKQQLSKFKQRIKQVEKALMAIDGYVKYAAEDYLEAAKLIDKAGGEDRSLTAELQVFGGEADKGLEQLQKQVERRPNEVIPLARLAFTQFEIGKTEEATKSFEKLRDASTSMDLDIPIFARLSSLAKLAGYDSNWKKHSVLVEKSELRPDLETLGPFRWSPPKAPSWKLVDGQGNEVDSEIFAGKPTLVIFFLGHGCLHCADQLKAFGPRVDDFRKAGIEIVTISTDSAGDLGESIKNYGSELPFAHLLADGEQSVFKKFRAFDDFEKQPLHGTFLIDGAGLIRWQDISYEPFMDHEFVLVEAQRLLSHPASSRNRKPKSTKDPSITNRTIVPQGRAAGEEAAGACDPVINN